MSDEEDTQVRIANALERIAAAMEIESDPGPVEYMPASKGIVKPNIPKRRVENINERVRRETRNG